jgi:hypothetical protein
VDGDLPGVPVLDLGQGLRGILRRVVVRTGGEAVREVDDLLPGRPRLVRGDESLKESGLAAACMPRGCAIDEGDPVVPGVRGRIGGDPRTGELDKIVVEEKDRELIFIRKL